MELEDIKTPEDVYAWVDDHIQYGWLDRGNGVHIGEMKDFRRRYRTMSVEESLQYQMGTCIEQVALMNHLLNQIHVENKMFCCRVFEPDDYGNLEEEEHMHCFLLYYSGGNVYHMEHPNREKKGIHVYASEEAAIGSIVAYYVALRGGKESPTTQFLYVPKGLSFRQFNAFINSQKPVEGSA